MLARRETRREIVVTLPFEFVVSGKTLPAGTYAVSRITEDKFEGLILSSYENRTSLFVHAVEIESASADKPQVSFERVGEQNFLSKIQTANDVYNIPVSVRSSWRPQRDHATMGLPQELPEATRP
jgi:hypothetical protein